MTKRRILYALIAALVSIAVAVSVAVGSGWLGRLVCRQIVAGLASATGGRVAVRSAQFDWRSLTAELDGVSVRGAGAKDAAPFLCAERLRLQFGIASVLKRQIDLASLVVVRPTLDFDLAPSAASNAAKLGRSAEHLRVHSLQIVQGVFQTSLQRYDLTVQGTDLNASAALEPAHPQYDIAISVRHLRLNSSRFAPLEGRGNLRARLESGRLTIEHLSFATEAAVFQAKGVVRSFAHPVADLVVQAEAQPAALAGISRLEGIESGYIDLGGSVHYDPLHSWTFNGKLWGRQIAARFRSVALKNIAVDANLTSQPGEARLSDLKIAMLGGTISGTATVRNGDLDFDGTVNEANISQASRLVSGNALGWAGAASGRIHFADPLGGPPDFKISGDVRISPLSGKIPVSGNVRFSYNARGSAIAFGSSQVNLPHTRLAFSGSPRGALQVALESDDMDDLAPLLASVPSLEAALPAWVQHVGLSFSGQIVTAAADPRLQGDFTLRRAVLQGEAWGPVRGHLILSQSAAEFSNVTASDGAAHASGAARLVLNNWKFDPQSVFRIQTRFSDIDLAKALAGLSPRLHVSAGTASGSLDLSGSVANPFGSVRIGARKLTINGQPVDSAQIAVRLAGRQVRIERARLASGQAVVTISGVYERAADTWDSGDLRVKVESSGFPIGRVLPMRSNRYGLAANMQVHGAAAAHVADGKIEPTKADGVLMLRNIRLNGVPLGSAKVTAATTGTLVQARLSGEILHAPLSGNLRIDAAPGAPAKGQLRLGRLALNEVAALVRPGARAALPVSGWMEGGVDFDGPLDDPARMHALAHIDHLQLLAKVPSADSGAGANDLAIRNIGALVFEIDNAVASVRSFHLGGQDTGIAVLGTIPVSADKTMDLTVGGSADLRIFELFDSRVRASGKSLISASVRGTVGDPAVEGTLELKNGSFFLDDVPNGLTAVNGTVSFNRDRATIRTMTAESGGGKLNLGGFVSFGGGPLVYNVSASAQNVRIRPAGGVSITANGSLRLSGTSYNGVLGGTISVSHIVVSANSDWAGLLAPVAAPAPLPGNANNFISGLQFDVHVVSAPNLQLTSSLGRDLETQIDLRLRGTLNQPVLLGSVSANQGELKIFGTNYTINHAEVHFTNPVEIEPAVDLDLQTQLHGVTVNITVAGSLNKLNINYRSDPPLQPRDIIALLAVGETPGTAANVVNAPTAAETAALESSANTVLGQAISPESGRLQKLFGITNIKIDPLAQGSTVTPESRLTVQQQISRNITVTYVTNLAQTSEQIFRLEWALSRQYSVIAERDDNGEFGIDIQYKKRF